MFDLWPSDCRMIVLETRQTEDPSGLSNLYLLEVAENYVLLPWRTWARWESSRCVWTPPLLLSRIKTNTRGGGDVCVVFTLDGDQCGFISHQRRKWCQQETVRTLQSWRNPNWRKVQIRTAKRTEFVLLPQYYWSQRQPAETDRMASLKFKLKWSSADARVVSWPGLVCQRRINRFTVVTL